MAELLHQHCSGWERNPWNAPTSLQKTVVQNHMATGHVNIKRKDKANQHVISRTLCSQFKYENPVDVELTEADYSEYGGFRWAQWKESAANKGEMQERRV